MKLHLWLVTVVVACSLILGVISLAQAQEPALTPDTEIFKRTPVIDGKVEAGEWDTFYESTVAGSAVITYADWDSNNLYFAAQCDKPFDMLVILDALGDGWFNGQDNYELKAIRDADGVVGKAVSRYESRNATSSLPQPVTANELEMVQMASGTADGKYFIEMKLPGELIRDFKLVDNAKPALQIATKTDAGDTGWTPDNVAGAKRECLGGTLLSKKSAALNPLLVDMDVRTPKIARTEDLFVRFSMINNGTESVNARTYILAGEGKSATFLGSKKVRMEGLPAKGKVFDEISTNIPSDMPLGNWAFGGEVRSDSAKIGAVIASFEVVDQWDASLKLPTKDISTHSKNVVIALEVRNNLRRPIRGTAKITLPLGWELYKNVDTKQFDVSSISGVTTVKFSATPPLGVLGAVPVKIEVSSRGINKTLEGSFNMVLPGGK